ncbi:outer membrane protein assembly factor BamD [Hahella ganghwensis]|uniref:outer membrane protein assembly factor BamD n=1 Tax=Hahella ganghwensis TaxID=286420 RepID=UPI00037438B0|nr:outer membrane protein assembly factor BamD [Hahella ganghwensis]
MPGRKLANTSSLSSVCRGGSQKETAGQFSYIQSQEYSVTRMMLLPYMRSTFGFLHSIKQPRFKFPSGNLTQSVRHAISIVLIAGLAACASEPPEILNEKEYYDKAKTALDNRNFLEASRHLEDLETYHPFGRYAEQAQLDLIYARYSALDPEGAAAAAERFIRLHPESPHVDYAFYIKGLASYYADVSLSGRYFPLNMDSRDPGRAKEAFQDFSTLVTQFPDSPYAADAEKRMVALKNRLAEYELVVAKYYIRRQAYVAAATRVQYIIENYPETTALPDALAYSVELYRILGMKEHANDALVVLATSYPDHTSFDADLRFRGGMIQEESRDISSVLDIDNIIE